LSIHGFEPALTPWSIGSLGTLGTSEALSDAIEVGVASAPAGASADTARIALVSSARGVRNDIRVICILHRSGVVRARSSMNLAPLRS
jgi:hypothetical protein